MELAGGPRLDEEGGGRLAGAEAQTTTWWTPFFPRPAAPLTTHNAKAVKPHTCTAQQTDGWTEISAHKEASRTSITTRKPIPTL